MRLNRTQALVLGFLTLAWIALVAILLLAPDLYAARLNVSPGDSRLPELGFFAAVSVLITLIATGVVRRWRWTFWVMLVASLGGVLRAPASLLQLTGVLPQEGPVWYSLLQAFIGVVQLALGLVMLADYRKAGVWGG